MSTITPASDASSSSSDASSSSSTTGTRLKPIVLRDLFQPKPDGHKPRLDEFLESLGSVPAHRVVLTPEPGTVTADDYEALDGRVNGMLVELVNGTLVEKTVGLNESRIGINLATDLNVFVRKHKVGFVGGADGMIRMKAGNIRMPDISVFLNEDLTDGEMPPAAAPVLPPRLAIEVLSRGNTEQEIDLKLHELFASGCRLAYVIDPRSRTARRYTSPQESVELKENDSLDGGEVLPGFEVKLADVLDVG
jgi:Uma2 family endonuclease